MEKDARLKHVPELQLITLLFYSSVIEACLFQNEEIWAEFCRCIGGMRELEKLKSLSSKQRNIQKKKLFLVNNQDSSRHMKGEQISGAICSLPCGGKNLRERSKEGSGKNRVR